jgi:hypothetical protein
MNAIYPKPKHLKVGDFAYNRKHLQGYQGIFNIFKVVEINEKGVVVMDTNRKRLDSVDPNLFKKWKFAYTPVTFRA